MITGIFNAKIEQADLVKNIDTDKIILRLEIKSTEGVAWLTFSVDDLIKIFSILEIENFDEIIGQPCLVLINDGIMKDIGNFMFRHYDFIKEPLKEESKYWVLNDPIRLKIYE
jgi:hypothetical protein